MKLKMLFLMCSLPIPLRRHKGGRDQRKTEKQQYRRTHQRDAIINSCDLRHDGIFTRK